jgi:hypothetical protein
MIYPLGEWVNIIIKIEKIEKFLEYAHWGKNNAY